MNKILGVVVLTLFFSNFLWSSTRGDVKIIEASENIQYLSQKIAIDYFFLYHKQKNVVLEKNLENNIKKLEFNINEIVNMTKSNKTKNILLYFVYNLQEIRLLSTKEMNLKSAKDILDYSEEFLEGTKAIINEHKYAFSEEEKMLMLSKKAQYLFEYVTTYYMASQIGLTSIHKKEKMTIAIAEIDRIISQINSYKYSIGLKKKVEKISSIWRVNREFFSKANGASIPYLLLGSTQYSKNILTDIERYHKKNL